MSRFSLTVDLPEWTGFVAIDFKGSVAAFETKPKPLFDSNQWLPQNGRYQEIMQLHHDCPDWFALLWKVEPDGTVFACYDDFQLRIARIRRKHDHQIDDHRA